MVKNKKWGFLRETSEDAKKAGKDKDTGLHRTGLNEYLKIIFPDVNDWIHNEVIEDLKIEGKICKRRPDYRSEKKKIIVEFDGIHHYKQPLTIKRDLDGTEIYERLGYKVVRIPYFIQLSNSAVKTLFDVDISEELFDEGIPSLGVKGLNTPAYLCPAGLRRMAEEFKAFPKQYEINVAFLKEQNLPFETGVDFLINEYNRLS